MNKFLLRKQVCRFVPALGVLLCAPCGARADQPVWATGHILDAQNRPMSNAIVAVYDDNNKVVDYARTDENGDYALAVPRSALHLQEHHSPGFFAEVFGGVTRFVGSTVGFVANPLRSGVKAVTSAEAATFSGPLTKGGIAVGGAIVDQALFAVSPKPKRPVDLEARKMPGALFIKVIAPQRNDLIGVTRVYWVQKETFKAHGRQTQTLAAWLDPVQLTQADSDKPSTFQSTYFNFRSARLEPSLAQPGAVVRIMATLQTPPEPAVHVIVVAQNNRTGQKWELQPVGNGRYQAEFVVDKHAPRDDHNITILAYAASELKPGRRPDVEKGIEGAGLWNPKKPYIYNPLLAVSRNRAELALTVLGLSKHNKD